MPIESNITTQDLLAAINPKQQQQYFNPTSPNYAVSDQPAKPQSTDGEYTKGFMRSFAEIPGLIAGVGAYAADVFGADAARDAMIQFAKDREQSTQDKYGSDASSFSSVLEGKASGWDFLKNASGYVTGQALQSLITGGLGAIGAKTLARQGILHAGEKVAAKQLAEGASAEVAKKAAEEYMKGAAFKAGIRGATAGAEAQNLTMELGSIYPDAVDQAQKEGRSLDGGDLARIGAAAVGASAVETGMDRFALGKILKGSKAPGSIAGRALYEIPEGVARESTTEGIQTGIERWGAGKSLTDEEAMRDYLDSVAVGAVGGAQAGGLASIRKADEAPNPLQPIIDKAAEPNSPLSRAVVATGAASQPAQAGVAPAQSGPGPSNDPYAVRAREIEGVIRNGNLLDAVRDQGIDAREVFAELQLMRNPNAPEKAKEDAARRVEEMLSWAQAEAQPRAPMDSIQNNPDFFPVEQERAPQVAPDLTAAEDFVRNPASARLVSDQDRNELLQNLALARNPGVSDGVRLNAGRAANEIVGRYQAASSVQPTAQGPALERGAPEVAPVASPADQQNVGAPTELDFLQQASEPRVAIPAGEGSALMRKRGAVVKQLAENGFETVLRDGKDFWMVNRKTGQKIKLDGPADAQMARKAINDHIDKLAHTAAASPKNDLLEPTKAQIDAGNYKKSDVININGVQVKIENPQGSVRRGVSPEGKPWETTMAHHYGEMQGTTGADGDKVDVFLGPRKDSDKIYVIDQVNKDGSFDEHKVMMGFTSEDAARQGYLANYEKGWTGLGAITEMTPEQFKEWAKSRAAKKPVSESVQQASEQAKLSKAQDEKNFIYIKDEGGRRPVRRVNKSELPEKSNLQSTGKKQKFGRDIANAIEKLAGLLGKKVEFFESVGASVAEGFIFKGNSDTIYVNTETVKSPVAIFGHEFFHTLRITNPKAWEAIASVVRERVTDPKGWRDSYYHAARIIDGNGLEVNAFTTVKEAEKFVQQSGRIDLSIKENSNDPLNDYELEELISDIGGNLVVEQKFWSEVLSKVREQNGPNAKGIIQKMIDTFNTFITKVFSGFTHNVFRSEKYINKDEFEKVRSAFASAVAEYMSNGAEGKTATEGDGVLKTTPRDDGKKPRAHTQVNKLGHNNWTALTDLSIEGMDMLLSTVSKGGSMVTSEITRDGDGIRTREIARTNPGVINQMSIGAEHKRILQLIRATRRNDSLNDSFAGRVKKSTTRQEDPPEGLTVDGYHFSKFPRQVLNSAMYGTGLRGSARDEIKQQGDERLKHRISFYVNKGTGINPEAGVGGVAHKATLTNVYDADADLLRLKGGSARDFESKVLDNGYDGYLNRMDGTQSGQVIMLGKRTITPEIMGPAAKITDAKVVPAPEQREPDLADRITSNKSLPSGQLSPARWSQVLMSQDPELAAKLLDIGALEGEQSMYKDELAAKARKLEGEIKKSTARAESEYDAVYKQFKDTAEWLKAPNGKETNLTERQWVTVRTPSFKNWFGDWEKHARAENPVGSLWGDNSVSKVVDDNGEPMVVYHGTDKGGFVEFEQPGGTGRGDLGIFTTDNEGMARSYVHKGRAKELAAEDLGGEQTPGVYALFVNIRNPLEDDFEGALWNGEREGRYQVRAENGDLIESGSGSYYFDMFDEANQVALAHPGSEVQPADSHYNTTDDVVREARNYSDGAIIRNVIDDGGGVGYNLEPSDVFVAFDPNQLKSADFNNGEFSDSTDIRKSPERSAEDENRMSVVVGGKPGEFDWNFTRSDLTPPPIQAPAVFGPRLEKIGPAVQKILSSAKFAKFAEDAFGIKGLRVVPINGSWLLNPEPSYALVADEMTYDQATDLSKILGFAFAQDATVVYQPKAMEDMAGTPAAYVGNDKRLTKEQLARVLKAAQDSGLDYSTTQDGKAVKFLYFGPSEQYFDFLDKVWDIKESSGLKYSDLFFVRSDLNEAKNYVEGRDGSGSKAAWLSDSESGSSGLFGRAVDSLIVPYAKAVGAEGYRFAVQRFADKFGLTEAQRELIRDALIPKNGRGKSTVAIASGEERLDITPTGEKGKPTVSDILWALQNRSAQSGLIEPGDYSERAQKVIAEAMAEEVIFHLERPRGGKSAIGWYDRALKAAKRDYQRIFPELSTDSDAEMLFDAIWGITSQGNDVFSNSIFGARVYNLVRNGQATIPDAVRTLRGTFGGETRAIENNLLKLHQLIERNGYNAMRKFFNTKGRVSDINAVLRKDTTLYFDNAPLQVEGQADQIVTGWMVFGPKIGSFINNLHGDYSTLTADLWFSRTWNRILGYSFVHAPALEAAQYQKFISALIAEYNQTHGSFIGPVAPKAVRGGRAVMPEFGTDLNGMSREEIDEVIANPYKALELATKLESAFRKGGYKVKSDLRRAGKVWVEGRESAVAAPRTDLERSFQQDTAELAQKIVRRKTGQTITIADIQAALWFYEKDDLFGPLGGTNKKSEGSDYANAADEMLRTYERGNLYYNKTDKVYVLGERGSYLDNFDPHLVNDAAAVQAEYQMDPVAGAKFNLEDDGQAIKITATKDIERTPDVLSHVVDRLTQIARDRGIELSIEPKTPRNWKLRSKVISVLEGSGFKMQDDESMIFNPESATHKKTAESSYNQRVQALQDLISCLK